MSSCLALSDPLASPTASLVQHVGDYHWGGSGRLCLEPWMLHDEIKRGMWMLGKWEEAAACGSQSSSKRTCSPYISEGQPESRCRVW